MSFIIGIDPGAGGAIAILERGGRLVHVFDMPAVEVVTGGKAKRRVSPEMLAAELRLYNVDGTVAFIEQVGAMPGQGVSSMFAFGEAFGLAKGVLAGLAIPVQSVTPGKWKKALQLNAGKDGARAKAAALWPEQAGEFRRVKDDGKAEAALIAYWGLAGWPLVGLVRFSQCCGTFPITGLTRHNYGNQTPQRHLLAGRDDQRQAHPRIAQDQRPQAGPGAARHPPR